MCGLTDLRYDRYLATPVGPRDGQENRGTRLEFLQGTAAVRSRQRRSVQGDECIPLPDPCTIRRSIFHYGHDYGRPAAVHRRIRRCTTRVEEQSETRAGLIREHLDRAIERTNQDRRLCRLLCLRARYEQGHKSESRARAE
jgi:hypothetical protein